MKVIEENETEIYIELNDKDLPYHMPSTGKKTCVRFESIEGEFTMPRIWKSKTELLETYPDKPLKIDSRGSN